MNIFLYKYFFAVEEFYRSWSCSMFHKLFLKLWIGIVANRTAGDIDFASLHL